MGNECLPQKKARRDNLKKYQKDIYSKSPVIKTLKVVVATWLLDRSKLFDQLDKHNLSVSTHRIVSTCKIQKKPFEDAQVLGLKEQFKGSSDKEIEIDLTFEQVEDGYKIVNNRDSKFAPWERVFQKWTSIQIGGVFKTGSTCYTLNKLILNKKCLVQQRSSQQIESMSHFGDDQQCRICYDNSCTFENPLISPCQCMGSVKYIHLKCLKQWLLASQNKNEDYIHIQLKKSKCQICNKSLLDSKAYKDIIGTLLSGDQSIPIPFAIFEGVHIDRENAQFKNYFIYSFKNNKTFSIGRGKKAEIRNEIDRSVSRAHAEVTLQNNQVMVRDLQSKFGTLKKVSFPFFIPFSKKAHKFQFNNNSISVFFERQNTDDVQTDSNQGAEDIRNRHLTQQQLAQLHNYGPQRRNLRRVAQDSMAIN